MRNRSLNCTVCKSEIRGVIDAELQKPPHARRPLRILSTMSGLSKSALSRHSTRCLIEARLAEHRDRRKSLGRINRIILKDATSSPPSWSWRAYGDEYFGDARPFDPHTGIHDDDLFLELAMDELRPEVLAHAEHIRLANEAKLLAAAIAEPTDTNVTDQDEAERPLE